MEDIKREEKAERCLLIEVDTGEYDAQVALSELTELAQTAGAEVVGTVVQKREAPDKATCIGSGRLWKLRKFVSMMILI